MDKLLESFPLGLLLRSGFSGAFFVLAIHVASSGDDAIASMTFSAPLSFMAVVSLFAGFALYTVHRSLLFPIIEWGMNSGMAKALRRGAPLISSRTMLLLHTNWIRGSETSYDREKGISRHLSAWGDYAHFQYTSALSIAVGASIGATVSQGEVLVHWLMLMIALVMLLAAFVSDWRWHAFVDWVNSERSASAT